ncbi:MAG: HAD hydrolase-like protein [Bdellovibrionales bacterium]|nr:HAD hydrolase-like protein [Bdellovibrionales bacterium]
MSIELIAFDFDGTLVHTAPDIIKATNAFLQLHGRKPLSDLEIIDHIGMGLVGLIRGVIPEAEHHPEIAAHVENQFSKIYDEFVLEEPVLFDGVEDFLKSCPLKIAVVSNKPERYIHQIFRHLKLDHYPWVSIVGGDTHPECKPNPLPLKTVMSAAKVTPNQTLMVGDGPPDVGVALACKSHLLAVDFGYSPLAELKSLGAEFHISHFNQIMSHIERLDQIDFLAR